MITVVVGKRRNTTPWFSAFGEKTAQTATANCTTATANRTSRDRKLYEPRPKTVRTATENRTNRDRKPYEPRPKTVRTATENRTNRDRKPHEPRQNRSVNLFLGSTVYSIIQIIN
jgi:hypothetical protein